MRAWFWRTIQTVAGSRAFRPILILATAAWLVGIGINSGLRHLRRAVRQ